MKNVKNYFLSFTLLLASSCACLGMANRCDSHKPPVVDHCIIGTATCICFNPNLDDEPRVEDIDFCENYHAVSNDDYYALSNWVNKKLEALDNCRRQ